MSLLEVLAPVNEGIFPVPLAASPILVLLLLQAKVVPLVSLVNTISAVVPVLQTVWFDGVKAVGIGLTITV